MACVAHFSTLFSSPSFYVFSIPYRDVWLTVCSCTPSSAFRIEIYNWLSALVLRITNKHSGDPITSILAKKVPPDCPVSNLKLVMTILRISSKPSPALGLMLFFSSETENSRRVASLSWLLKLALCRNYLKMKYQNSLIGYDLMIGAGKTEEMDMWVSICFLIWYWNWKHLEFFFLWWSVSLPPL